MRLRRRTINQLADLICGNEEAGPHFRYRSSSYLTEFFADAETEYTHDGSTRKWWVVEVLEDVLSKSAPNPTAVPDAFARIIATLMDRTDPFAEKYAVGRPKALVALNNALNRDGYEAFYAENGLCYVRHSGSGVVGGLATNPHRPLTALERDRRSRLDAYLDRASEDNLIEEVLLPLFRQLGFERISATGHQDKALEYGKDVWMRLQLPTQHMLYFGIQAKKGTLDAAGAGRSSNANVAEILNQIVMMLGHQIFDPEANRRVLVDHAYIVAGGKITKAARNWLAERLDASKRSSDPFHGP